MSTLAAWTLERRSVYVRIKRTCSAGHVDLDGLPSDSWVRAQLNGLRLH